MTVVLRDPIGTFLLIEVEEIQMVGDVAHVGFKDGSEDKFPGAEILSAVE